MLNAILVLLLLLGSIAGMVGFFPAWMVVALVLIALVLDFRPGDAS